MESKLNINNKVFISTFTSGAFTLANILTYPLDLINSNIKSNFKDSKSKIIKNTFNKNGFRGLFKGIFSVIPTNFPSCFSWYYVYETANKYAYQNFDKKNYKYIPFVNSFLAEIVCVALLIPADTIQTRIQTGKYRSFMHGFMSVINNGSFLKLYKSSYLMFSQQILFMTTQYSFYEHIRAKYINYQNKQTKTVNLNESIALTIFATFFSNLLVNPINFFVIQFQLLDSRKKKITLKSIYKEKKKKYGISVFNRGLGLRFLHMSLLSSIYIPTYEYIRQIYGINPSDYI